MKFPPPVVPLTVSAVCFVLLRTPASHDLFSRTTHLVLSVLCAIGIVYHIILLLSTGQRHPTKEMTSGEGAPDPTAVRSLFDRIAPRYDITNRVMSFWFDLQWRKKLIAKVVRNPPNGRVVDLATGSGDVAFALARALPASSEIIGMDFCQGMLDQAIIKQRQMQTACPALGRIHFQQGDGMALPLADSSVDALTVSFGLRNMASRSKALAEMHRVIRPGGHLYVLEFSQPWRWFRPMYLVYLRFVLPLVAGLLTGDKKAYQYLNHSIECFPNRAALAAEIRQAGFTRVEPQALFFGVVALHHAVN
eukprot:GAFH01003246.1.p1 GENE.GAFH01003246.1~~GAFH01003246.1.p1  ORF type:complete len:306 (-),score=52.65 GAFH01003246.1:49-966(-)